MVRRRANACWKMLTDPEHVSMKDVSAVFFEDCRERYYMEVVDPPSCDGDSQDGVVDAPSPGVAKVFNIAAERRVTAAANALAFGPENRPPTVSFYDLLGFGELTG